MKFLFLKRFIEIVLSNSKNSVGKIELKQAVEEGNIKVYTLRDQELVNRLYGKLHKGELETIIAASELEIEYVLLDERAARNLAETFSLEPIGLLGVLVLAKAMGSIEELKCHLDLLMTSNYRISKKLYMEILQENCEL